jgi:hypothetical protein
MLSRQITDLFSRFLKMLHSLIDFSQRFAITRNMQRSGLYLHAMIFENSGLATSAI